VTTDDGTARHGADDPRPVQGAAEVAALACDGRLEVIDGAGHLPWAEQPLTFADAIRRFVVAA